MSSKAPRRPVQVYLDPLDRALLERLVESTEFPRTDLIRRGLRVLAANELSAGNSMEALIGAFGDGPDERSEDSASGEPREPITNEAIDRIVDET